MNTTLYIPIKNSDKFNFIELSVVGDKLISNWGQVGSPNTQTASKTCLEKNIGKTNYVSGEQQAQLELDRKVKKLKDEGYTEGMYVIDKNTMINNSDITLSNLPKSFCPSKPISKPPDSIFSDTSIIAQRKLNGNCIIITKLLDGTKKVYSRRMEDYNRLLNIDCVLEVANSIPVGTMVVCEFVFDNAITKKEDTKIIGSVCRTKDAIDMIYKYNEYKTHGTFKVVVFDVLFMDDKFMGNLDFIDRYDKLKELSTEYVFHIPINYDYATWKVMREGIARTDNWEGFVLRYPTGKKSYISYTINGKADRQGSYKDKFVKEGDFIVYKVECGTGKFENIYSKFYISQLNDDNSYFDCGNAGPGKLKHEELIKLNDDINNGTLKLPFVVEIEYRDRQDSGKLEFPQICRIRYDKSVDDCFVDF